MSDFSRAGGCLCGKVRFQADAEKAEAGLCHCKMCRRWAGGLPLAVMHAQVTLQQQETLTWWQSSTWGMRGFCAACGSSLFWRLQDDSPQPWAVSLGALDDDSGLQIKEHIFYDDKATFYETTDTAERLSGAAFTAKVLRNLAAQHGEAVAKQALEQLRQHSGEAFAAEVEGALNSSQLTVTVRPPAAAMLSGQHYTPNW